MFGINFWEFIIILLAVIVFVRPEEMPAFFRKVGRYYAQLQHYIRRLRSYSSQSFERWSEEEPVPPPAVRQRNEPNPEIPDGADVKPIARRVPGTGDGATEGDAPAPEPEPRDR